MGEVYRATDTQLKRDVAIKVLPPGLAEDRERLARFEREAQVLAQLHHPHIATIFGLAHEGATRALVMELIEGPTLAERLGAGPLPIDEALAIARQIAAALEAAHEKGIVHRDLKPQNVKAPLTGDVKVLDFGLAKAMDPASGAGSHSQLAQSPTLTMGATEMGVILGTAAYMAPEQAKGQAVDKRADIWAFGVVLFEMLTGRSLFAGETVSDTLAGVLRSDVDFGTLPKATPGAVRTLLHRCLERNPRERLRDIGEARIALARPHDSPATLERSSDGAPRTAWRRLLPWGLAATLAVALVAVELGRRRSAGGASIDGPTALAIRLPPALALPLDDRGIYGQTAILAISPRGDRVVFVGGIGDQAPLYTRSLASSEVVAIEGTEGGSSPFFSPDGRWIGFFGGGKLRKVLVDGGKPIDLADAGLDRGAVWLSDGSIVFAPAVASGLFRLPSGGGEPVALTTPDASKGERTHRWPAALPGGREVAFTVGLVGQPGDYESSAVDVVEIATGKRRPLLRGASMVRFTSSGHALLGREGQVLALPLEAARRGATEDARPVLRSVAGIPSSGIVHFEVAENGTVLYAEREAEASRRWLAWLDADGTLTDLPLPPADYWTPVVSPDGRRIAYCIGPPSGRSSDVWVLELASGAPTRLTFDGRSFSPIWSRDGRSVVYTMVEPNGAETFASRPADGGAEAQILLSHPDGHARAGLGWLADGSFMYWEDGGVGKAGDLVYVPQGSTEPLPFDASPAIELLGAIAPDGRHVAYGQDNGGVIEIYVQPFPRTGAKWQVGSGVTAPRFSRDGRELYFIEGRNLMALPVSLAGAFSSGTARPRVALPPSVNTVIDTFANYDVAPDGRFLVVRTSSETFTAGHINVTLNWFSELRRLAPTVR
jgi:serine/threonine-protein kinase